MSWYIKDGLLENIAIPNIKGVGYKWVTWNMTRNDTPNKLNNSKLDDKGSIWINNNRSN